ncbi:MAG: DNA cytosine methyltransferase [Roseiarcus sp.]
MSEFTYYEFFAGGGMARAGLQHGWRCLFANDFDHKKGAIYRANWRDDSLRIGDVRSIRADEVPGTADLAWASFPCQDLSLAGGGAGLRGERSGTFWPYWLLIRSIAEAGRAPSTLVLENVCGTLTSHEGKDFRAICAELFKAGYRFGTMVIDAASFVPQSRPRLFIVATRDGLAIPSMTSGVEADAGWTTRSLLRAFEGLPAKQREAWIWWRMPAPAPRVTIFADLIEDDPIGVVWHTAQETRALLAKMTEVNRAKVDEAIRHGRRVVGAVYKRTRLDSDGEKIQRAEVRFDGMAGCLRTPAGGSSRQIVVIVDGRRVRSRLISARETARLMGLPDSYQLPENYNEAYHLTGDGVAVPVVRHVAAHVLEPIIALSRRSSRAAA